VGTELARLRKQMFEQDNDIAFLKERLGILGRQSTESRAGASDVPPDAIAEAAGVGRLAAPSPAAPNSCAGPG